MLPMARRLTGLLAVLCIGSSSATPQPFFSLLEGSTDEDELTNYTSFLLPTGNASSEEQTTPAGPAHVEPDFLSKAANFMEENMLLILVVGSFVLVIFLMICGAVFMSRRRKVNAYYPSSFPSKMYVDHRDKNGGAKIFNEVPEKAAPEQESEPVDSHKQLQADIMRAAKKLRTPSKSVDAAEGSDSGQKAAESLRQEDGSKPDGSAVDEPLPSLPEEKEPGELPGGAGAGAGAGEAVGGLDLDPPEQPPHPEGSPEPATSRSLRPSSLHLHNDSATLQLIAGEKTAF